MDSQIVQIAFVVQFAVVSAVLLSALIRAQRSRPAPADGSLAGLAGAQLRLRRPVRGRPATGSMSAVVTETDEAELAALRAERAALQGQIDRIRAAQAEEELSFRARRREALLELYDHRQRSTELSKELPPLEDLACRLRAEVEHLEHRRTALLAEVSASGRTSVVLRERAANVRREIASLRIDRDRLGQRLHRDGERLRDLARRRAVLQAESEELMALLDLLQRLADQPESLTHLSDGELRGSTTPERRPGTPTDRLAASPSPSYDRLQRRAVR